MPNITVQRFVGLDVHKTYVMVGAVDAHQAIVLPPRRVALVEFEPWARQNLRASDAIVLEATTNAWYLYDLLTPLVAQVVVAHAYHVKLIAASMVKTDKRDTLVLARLLAANLIPPVWVPPPPVRQLRALIAHRERLVAQRTAAKNRLRSLLHRHNLLPPAEALFSDAQSQWWEGLSLPGTEKLRARQDRALLTPLSQLILEVETELARLSLAEPWHDPVTYLIQLPGIGLLSAMTLLAAIGDIRRFPSAKKLVGYAGLGARVYVSGQTHRTGRITKQGRPELRTAMIEAAWAAVRHYPHWKAQFERLAQRLGKSKAIVAVARKLLVVVWHVLTASEADRFAEPQVVARSLMTWGTRYGLATSHDLSRAAFVRRELERLGIGHDLEQFRYGNQVVQLAAAMSPAD
jgi:transposase